MGNACSCVTLSERNRNGTVIHTMNTTGTLLTRTQSHTSAHQDWNSQLRAVLTPQRFRLRVRQYTKKGHPWARVLCCVSIVALTHSPCNVNILEVATNLQSSSKYTGLCAKERNAQ